MTIKKTRGRPTLRAGEGKEAIVVLRLTKEERSRYLALAEKQGMKLSAWIRWALGGLK